MKNDRYPDIRLRSKNEIIKRISRKDFSQQDALNLLNDCLINFNEYWADHPDMSDPSKDKWVRNASYSPLGKLHKIINRGVLAPYDCWLPQIIHGGVRNKDIKSAAKALLGTQRRRTLLKIDMRRFYEHIPDKAVSKTLNKMGCSKKAAKLLTDLCCVCEGPKDDPCQNRTLARGFATSSRLAVWCNLDLFCRIFWLVEKRLRGHNPRVVIYVDDICITASRVTPLQMAELYFEIEHLVAEWSDNQLEINTDKTKIITYENRGYDLEGNILKDSAGNELFVPYETLGITLKRNSLDVSQSTRSKADRLKSKDCLSVTQKRTKKGIDHFRQYVKSS